MLFVTQKKLFLAIAAIMVSASIGVLVTLGLPLGIDFTGGSLTEVSYEDRPEKLDVEASLADLSLGPYSLRETVSEDGRDGYVLRTRDLEEEERKSVEAALEGIGVSGQLERFTSVGPVIGQELRDKALWAIGGVILVIIIYVAYAFRGIGSIGRSNVSSWHYGLITIVALAHDVIIPTAAFSLLGYFTGAEADVLFVMALLAVLGYSVNDTIVVFDRVRENLKLNQEKAAQLVATHGKKAKVKEEAEAISQEPFAETVGRSVGQTIMRSVNTSITTILALGALFWLGGDITRDFTMILLVGVVAGTYSSIALANPLLVFISERLPERDFEAEARKEKEKAAAPGMPVV